MRAAFAEAGLPVICVETRHMRAVLKPQINKTDRNDARGIAQMMRAGLYRPVHVKTVRSQKLRMLLTHRKLLQSKAIAVENDLRGTLRNFGFKVGMVGTVKFEATHQGAGREPPRSGGTGRTAAHCPAGASRPAWHPAPSLAGDPGPPRWRPGIPNRCDIKVRGRDDANDEESGMKRIGLGMSAPGDRWDSA